MPIIISSKYNHILKPFNPGENFQIKNGYYRKAHPSYKKVSVEAFGRLHFGLFDHDMMHLMNAGGGGIGITTDVVSHKIEILNNDSQVKSSSEIPTVKHLLKLFTELVNYDEKNISINVSSTFPRMHSGFGSNVALNTSVFWALNILFGGVFSVDETIKIINKNYVENYDNSHLIFDYDTAVGEASLLYGGFVFLDVNGKFLGSINSDNLKAVVAFPKENKLIGTGMNNSQKKEIEYRKRYKNKLKQFVDRQLKPIFFKGDLNRFLKIAWKMNDIGTFKALESYYKKDVMINFNNVVRNEGGLFSGISSAGPTMFAIVPSIELADILKLKLSEHFSDYFSEFKVGNIGKKLITKIIL